MKKRNGFIALLLSLCLSMTTPASGADLVHIPIVKMKTQFLSLYREQWKLFGTEDKLNKFIDEAIEEQTANLMWGTVGIQLGTNYDGIVDKIQEAAGFKFSPTYEKFIAELEESFAYMLRKEILEFYEEANAKLSFQLEDNPMAQANLRHDYDTVMNSQGAVIISDISKNLSNLYGDNVGSGLSAGALGTGLLTVIGTKYLQKKLMTMVGAKIAKSAVGKLAGAAIPVAGWIMAAWGAWDIYSMAVGAEDTVRHHLHDMNQSMYTREIPLSYWEGMEPYVRDSFVFAYDRLQRNVDKSYELQGDPIVQELLKNMNKSQENFFAMRVAVLDDALKDYKASKDNLFKYFGETVRDISIKNFESFVLMLREGDWKNLKTWIDFAGVEQCCDLYVKTSLNFWSQYSPSQESLQALSKGLPPSKSAAPALPPESTEETPKLKTPPKPSTSRPPIVTDLDKIKFLNSAQENFMDLFVSQWIELNMAEHLMKDIDTAVEVHTRDMMWGTVEIQLRSNTNNVIGNIQELTNSIFIEYSELLKDIEKKFVEFLRSEIVKIYKKANLAQFTVENNPMKRAEASIYSNIREKRSEIFNKWLNEERTYMSFDGISQQLYDINYSIYVKKLPEIFWSVIQPYVEEAFIEACSN